MKKIVLLFSLLCSCAFLAETGYAQCKGVLTFNQTNPSHANRKNTLLLNIKADFCAKGDGKSDDQPAFEAASAFIKARGGYCKLIIPTGTYRVGRQVKGTARIMDGMNVLELDFCNNVEIAGQSNAKLQYKNNMMYGYFNRSTMAPQDLPDRDLDPISYAADLGYCIYIRYSKNIKVSNLILDGNLYPNTMKVGGNYAYGFHGIQQAHYGIAVFHSRNINISNITARRFGLDGFFVQNSSPREFKAGNVIIRNCIADYNGRQGISIVAGDSTFVQDSKFMNTAMGIITQSGLQLGMDIEPEEPSYVISNVFVTRCKFLNNRAYAVAITSGKGNVRNVNFDNCEFRSKNPVTIELGRFKDIKFRSSIIQGDVRTLGSTPLLMSKKSNSQFINCTFVQ